MIQNFLDKIANGETHYVFDCLDAVNPSTTRDDSGVSLIQWCAYYGDVSAIRFLLRNGEQLHSLGHNFDLIGAVFHGHLELTKFLVEQGADVNKPLPVTGETPLHSALCSSDRTARDPILKVLIAHGANPNCATNPSVETDAFMRDVRTRAESPLHRAAAYGNEQTIQILLDAGARVDAKDMNGDTPLTWASWHLRPRSILRLLCYGQHRA